MKKKTEEPKRLDEVPREPQPSLLIHQFPNEWQRFVNRENDSWGSRGFGPGHDVHVCDGYHGVHRLFAAIFIFILIDVLKMLPST